MRDGQNNHTRLTGAGELMGKKNSCRTIFNTFILARLILIVPEVGVVQN
jgi:hypothetical protein